MADYNDRGRSVAGTSIMISPSQNTLSNNSAQYQPAKQAHLQLTKPILALKTPAISLSLILNRQLHSAAYGLDGMATRSETDPNAYTTYTPATR